MSKDTKNAIEIYMTCKDGFLEVFSPEHMRDLKDKVVIPHEVYRALRGKKEVLFEFDPSTVEQVGDEWIIKHFLIKEVA